MYDFLDEMYILNEARAKQTVMDDIQNKSDILIIHLFKLYFWGPSNATNVNGWITEISGMYSKTYQWNGKKYLDKELIESLIWKAWEENPEKIIKEFNKKSNNITCPYIDSKKIYNSKALEFSKKYINWLSGELSDKGVVSKNKCRDVLNDLCLKYNINVPYLY